MKRNWLVDYLRATNDSHTYRGERITQTGKKEITYRVVSPNTALLAVVKAFQRKTIERGLVIRVDIQPNTIHIGVSANKCYWNRDIIKANPVIKFLRSRSNLLVIDGQDEPEQKKIGLPEVKWRKLHEGIIPRTINREELSTGNVNKK